MKTRIMLPMLATLLILFGCGSNTDPALLGSKSGHYDFPTWSRDGKRLAFTLKEDLWLSNADGRSATRITGGFLGTDSLVKTASWLPDGRIAYVESTKGEKGYLPHNTLVIYDPATKKRTVARDNLNPTYDLAWHPSSPDTALLVMNLSPDVRFPGKTAVFELDVKAGTLNQIQAISPHGELSAARWLADGEQIAYVLDNTLYVLDRTTGTIQSSPFDTKAIGHVSVSPDRKKIAYRRYAKRDNGWTSGTYIVSSDFSGPPTQISKEEMVRMVWSPDGKQLIYTTVGSPGKNELRMFILPESPGRV